jgi:hypothetical protein
MKDLTSNENHTEGFNRSENLLSEPATEQSPTRKPWHAPQLTPLSSLNNTQGGRYRAGIEVGAYRVS